MKASVEASLAALQTESIDLYLIHHPWDNLAEIAAVWAVLEAYVDKGVLKAIGVSNFQEEELSYLLANSRIKPAVNQIESHPGKWNDAIIAYSLANQKFQKPGGPFADFRSGSGNLTQMKRIKNLEPVVLRYQIERGDRFRNPIQKNIKPKI